MKKQISQSELIMEFFTNNSNVDIEHPIIVDWLTDEYKKRTGKVFRDPDRGIRKLSQAGLLQKIKKGTYRYDPEHIITRQLEDFTPQQKIKILERDNYRCVICGKGQDDGIELQVDHIKPKDFGGKAIIANGQTLCASHNFKKKNYNQTETGKKMFIRLYELSKAIEDKELESFCTQILEVFELNQINGHIQWKK